MARKLRSKNGPRDSRNRAPPSKEANLIQIDVPPRRRQIRVLLGLFQQLVEFLFEHLAVRFLRFELLAENLVAPPGLALQFGHRRRQIFDRGRLLRHRVGDHGPRLGINFQNRVAAGTLDLEQTFRHSAHRSTHGVSAYKPSESNCEDWRDSEVIGGVTGWREPNGESIASRWACSLCVTPLYIAIASPNHNPIMLNQLSETTRAPRAKFGTRRHDLSNSGTVLERKVVTPYSPG